MPSEELFTKEQVLGGLVTQRARTLLFLIESRVAHMAAKSQQAMNRFLTEESERERDLAFFEAFALGREPPLRPTIQHLEQYAPHWAALVPDNPRLRAATAHFMSAKYKLTYQAVPNIRAALGLDQETVRQAYAVLYGKPLDTIFAPQVTLLDRLRWAGTGLSRRLENLPPFWTVFALTLTETVGAGVLALPIAMAQVGPLAGLAFLVALGLVNVLTIVAMAESVARTGSVRYGNAFFGRLVAEYLGNAGSLILTLALTVLVSAALLAYYIGFSTTLADATRLPAEVWCGLLLLIGLYFLSHGSLNSTVASALVIGAIDIGLILFLSLIALPHLSLENLLYVRLPFVGGRPFEPSILELIFGTVLIAYFGHTSVGNCGKLVLRRDPSARSLIWGAVAAQATAIVFYCLWVLAVNGAIAPEVLASQQGTSLQPLAVTVGPVVHVLGSIFVILGMGMASIHVSLCLFNIVRERLPAQSQPTLLLPRLRGRLLLHPRAGSGAAPCLSMTYLGRESNQCKFRLEIQRGGTARRAEITTVSGWDERHLFERFPDLCKTGMRLKLEVLNSSQEYARIRVISPWTLTYEEDQGAVGLDILDALAVPQAEWQLVQWMLRQGQVRPADVASYMGQDEPSARAALDALVKKGSAQQIQAGQETYYRARLARRRGRALPDHIWGAWPEPPTPASRPSTMNSAARWIRDALQSQAARFLLSLSPVALIFLLAEWLLLVRAESFIGAMNFGGVIAAPIFAGIFPVLLLMASRRKGDIAPPTFYRVVGHPIVLAGIYMLFLASILAHGLVIWQAPIPRAAAVLAGLVIVGMTIATVRRGAFKPRTVVELRQDAHTTQAKFAVITRGQLTPARVRFEYTGGEQSCQAATGETPELTVLRRATFELDAQAQELKVWAHRITPEGDSESLPASVEMRCGGETKQFDLKLSGGQIVQSIAGEPCELDIWLRAE